jgi:hypothetical protein
LKATALEEILARAGEAEPKLNRIVHGVMRKLGRSRR